MSTIKHAWDHIYGSKSPTNLAGKLLLGVPLAPFVVVLVLVWALLDVLFSE